MASNANTSRNPSENPTAKGPNLNEKSDPNSNLQSLLELLLLQQREQNRNLFPEREIDSNIRRSGSAPSMDEGSLRSGSGLFRAPNLEQSDNNSSNSKNKISNNNSSCNNNSSASLNSLTEEEIRSHPAYLEYYYAHDNASSRLPPPLLSKEDWLMLQRVKASGYGLGHPRNKSPSDESVNSLLFSMQHMKNEEDDIRKAALRNISRKNSSEILDKLTHSGSGMGLRRKSFADILQEGTSQPATSRLSRPSSQNSMTEPNLLQMGNKSEMSGNLLHPNSGSSLPSGAAEMLRKSPSSGLFSGSNLTENLNPATNGLSNVAPSSIFELADAAESLSGLNMLSRGHQLNREDILRSSLLMRMGGLQSQNNQQQHYLENLINSGLIRGLNSSSMLASEPMGLPRRTSSTTNLSQAHLSPSDLASLETMQSLFNQKPNTMMMNYNHGGGSPLRNSNQAGTSFPFMDLDQVQSLRGNSSPAGFGNNINNNPRSCNDLQALEKAYLEALLLQQKQQYLSQFLHEISKTNHQLHGNASLGAYASSPSASPKSSMFQSDRSGDSPSTASRGEKVEPTGFSRSKSGSNLKGSFESSMDVAKNSKIKSLQLSDVLGHVVEFSKDRYGSRSIQQMLETANDSEKAKIFSEIIPHARELITDVYGNYVIQKFFEHGSETQRKELATHLVGRVLPLSLHMYGCRVVQKALEVVDVELKTKMVTELDGSITKCVCDQNGNHVIQKCIEHVPRDRIRFIFRSFLGQVVNLSSHPYGCRVIQRVLEHCDDPYTQQKIMDEILGSVCNLAQDQYGNYVLQHMLEHGKPGDRSAIVTKLAGQIVKMSQQKFASNVIEKCLVYGGPEERRIVVHEMLGSTDDNEPLQAMMKDPFGNYVVQKVLETCDDQSRELILSRIRVHLSALKRYTYGKHIVSRVEKLVTAGEKHIKKSSSVGSS